MKKLAVISDVHSNLEALQAVLADAGGFELACLGDVVGYGASPNEVLELLRGRHVVSVMGNHDQAAATGDASWFNARAAMALQWTRRRLSEENLEYLRSLPLHSRMQVEEVELHMVHGSPDDPLREYVFPGSHEGLFEHYLSRTGAGVLALGHTHVPFLWTGERGTVFNPGSVGQPRDGDPRAAYALLEVHGERTDVELRRVEYDVAGAAHRIIRAGLPRPLADRLYEGR